MQFRTDLAMESSTQREDTLDVETKSTRFGSVEEFFVRVKSPAASERIGKAPGVYITLTNPELLKAGAKESKEMAQALAHVVRTLVPQEGDILIIGLGNRHITADALGSRVLESLLVTRHMRRNVNDCLKRRLRGVCALAPGVLGITGIETAEVVRGIVAHVRPCAVIAIDALAARETARICTTIQVTDTGIRPGSGVGNHRMGLTVETLGVPVIAIGVPMVVYASVIAKDALGLLINDLGFEQSEHEAAIDALVERVVHQPLGDLVVTPREVDDMVGIVGEIIAKGLNLALHPKLTDEEISAFSHRGV